MAKFHKKSDFLDLVRLAAKELGVPCEIAPSHRKGCPATLITLTFKTNDVRQYILSDQYEFGDKQSSYDEILKKLFGLNKREWPACLPGSKSQLTMQPS